MACKKSGMQDSGSRMDPRRDPMHPLGHLRPRLAVTIFQGLEDHINISLLNTSSTAVDKLCSRNHGC